MERAFVVRRTMRTGQLGLELKLKGGMRAEQSIDIEGHA